MPSDGPVARRTLRKATLSSLAVARWAHLGRPRVEHVAVERDLKVDMSDGALLLADRWYPVERGPFPQPRPVVLVRSPYGRWRLRLIGRLLAERGYQALLQSCRGTFGSGGEWDPFHQEASDGVDTMKWIANQPWGSVPVVTYGSSYMGLTQWALAGQRPPAHAAMALNNTSSCFRDAVVFPGGSFSYETGAAWLYQLEHQEKNAFGIAKALLTSSRVLGEVFRTLPLNDADMVGLGRRLECYHDWLEHDKRDDPWWDPFDFSHQMEGTPPSTMVVGWYDPFLPFQIADYLALRAAGSQVRLSVGPWWHTSFAGMAAALEDGIDFFDEVLAGRPSRRRSPVRLWVLGANRWVDVPEWPPPATAQPWYLHAGGGLGPDVPGPSEPDRYTYDPAHPTPGIGGPSLTLNNSGPKDQTPRERRDDVLCYTSPPLEEDLTVAGPMQAVVWLRSSLVHTDLFVRLCDVEASGKSINISDGILRLGPGDLPVEPDGSWRVAVPMWPTVVTFRRGHRVRLQVSSGAHPLFLRNLGTGEPIGTGTTLRSARQEVFHDSEHSSAIELPVSPGLW